MGGDVLYTRKVMSVVVVYIFVVVSFYLVVHRSARASGEGVLLCGGMYRGGSLIHWCMS